MPGNEHEFGYYKISATEAGKNLLPDWLVVAECHYHEFQIPDGGELLASSDLFVQQAIKYGNNCFAFQFHAEATPDVFRRWQQQISNMYGKPGAQTREQQNALMEEHDIAQHQWFMQFQENFFSDAIIEMREARSENFF